MQTAPLLKRLVTVYRGENIRHPNLRAVTLAQWMLESGRATSELAKQHYNFGGLKWRREMSPYATRVAYEAHDGVDYYCKFATLESFVNGYWAFLNRSPYSGWEGHAGSDSDFIQFIGAIYTPSNRNYARDVLRLVPEATELLAQSEEDVPVSSGASEIGTIVIDPGHGGSQNMPGVQQTTPSAAVASRRRS
jgi:N-acetylmuramoyl-L-alanine amidase